MTRILFVGNSHHKIKKNMMAGFNLIGVQCDYSLTATNINNYDIIYSPATYIPIENYPTKKFVFGPQFSVFPNQIVNRFNNKHKNAIYIQPSEWPRSIWRDELDYKTLDIHVYPIGVDTDDFIPIDMNRDKVMVYNKRRTPDKLKFVLDYLKENKIMFELITYGSYNEKQFKDCLNRSKCAIWIGCNESQGLGLLETLSMNVPILVWNVRRLDEEFPLPDQRYKNINTISTTVPYWDNKCGEVFYEQKEFENAFNKILNGQYQPREFILENFTLKQRAAEFLKLCNTFDSSIKCD